MTRKIVLGIFLLTIIFFLMPWMNISCMGTPVVTVSGYDMVRGVYDVPDEVTDGSSESEPLVIWALVAAGVGLIASLFKAKIMVFTRILAGIAGVALLIALKFKIDNDVYGQGQGVAQVNYLIGYWLTLIAFAAAVIVSFIKRDSAAKDIKTPEPTPQGSVPPAEKPPSV